MVRTFEHSFYPPALDPVLTGKVELTVAEIEAAGINEVLATPGPALGSWNFLDALLSPTGGGTPFVFQEPLGQAREVKVALSGLFGRFVARAYSKSISSYRFSYTSGAKPYGWTANCGLELSNFKRRGTFLIG